MKPAPTPVRPPAKGKGKQVKRFLDNEGALALVSQIVDGQEAKRTSKSDRTHQPAQPPPATKKPSVAKLRLKQKKVELAEQLAIVKKTRNQQKKKRERESQKPTSTSAGKSGVSSSSKPNQKRVSFA